MNKIDPFEVEDEGSDQENISVLPSAPLLEGGVQPQQQEVNDCIVVISV